MSDSPSSTAAHSTTSVPPGGTIGCLGGGQLGKMMTHAAQRLGYRVVIFDPDEDACGGRAADRHVARPFDDVAATDDFAAACDVVTLEFENVPVEAARRIAETTPVRPGPHVLEIAQHRLREKTAVNDAGVPTVRFEIVDSQVGLCTAMSDFPRGCVLKTLTEGYDGRGQRMIRPADDAAEAYRTLAGGRDRGVELIVEELVDLTCEVSVLAARSPNGETVVYDPVRNDHRNHILDLSVSPWDWKADGFADSSVCEDARAAARTLVEAFDAVGLMCVEFFLTGDGRLLVNEVAPRPHNSGHLTIEAHACSQFEQQVRAVCGLPLGSPSQTRPAAMANILGDAWPDGGVPDWSPVLKAESAALHLYGKADAKPGRKMGHLTCVGDHAADAAGRLSRDLRAVAGR